MFPPAKANYRFEFLFPPDKSGGILETGANSKFKHISKLILNRNAALAHSYSKDTNPGFSQSDYASTYSLTQKRYFFSKWMLFYRISIFVIYSASIYTI